MGENVIGLAHRFASSIAYIHHNKCGNRLLRAAGGADDGSIGRKNDGPWCFFFCMDRARICVGARKWRGIVDRVG